MFPHVECAFPGVRRVVDPGADHLARCERGWGDIHRRPRDIRRASGRPVAQLAEHPGAQYVADAGRGRVEAGGVDGVPVGRAPFR